MTGDPFDGVVRYHLTFRQRRRVGGTIRLTADLAMTEEMIARGYIGELEMVKAAVTKMAVAFWHRDGIDIVLDRVERTCRGRSYPDFQWPIGEKGDDCMTVLNGGYTPATVPVRRTFPRDVVWPPVSPEEQFGRTVVQIE